MSESCHDDGDSAYYPSKVTPTDGLRVKICGENELISKRHGGALPSFPISAAVPGPVGPVFPSLSCPSRGCYCGKNRENPTKRGLLWCY